MVHSLSATNTQPVGDRLPAQRLLPGGVWTPSADDVSWEEMAQIEARFAGLLAAFNYEPRRCPNDPSVPGPVASRSKDTPQAPVSAVEPPKPIETVRREPILPNLGAIWETDPVLHRRLRPNTSAEMQVLGRTVIMDVDATGCRPVIGQPAEGERALAAYGCSCTYGIALMASETFCSLLQAMFPAWRVENHGAAGYGTTQNVIQLERNTRWNKPEFVTFCWIHDHLRRNVASLAWAQLTSGRTPKPTNGKTTEWRVPRAALDSNGALEIRSTRMPRHDLVGIDFSDFSPDSCYLDLVCLRLFERAHAIVTEYGGHFFITTLWGRLSAGLAARLAEKSIPVVNASVSGREYTCLPDDGHPNALANQIYAERIRDYLQQYVAGRPVTGAGASAASQGSS